MVWVSKPTGTIYSRGDLFVAPHPSRYPDWHWELDERTVRYQLFCPCVCTSSFCQSAGLGCRQESHARLFVVDYRVMHASSFLQLSQ